MSSASSTIGSPATDRPGALGTLCCHGGMWLPRELVGHWSRSNAAYRILGGRLRPLRATLDRTLADERSRGLDRERRSGLSRSEELALLSELS